MDTKQVLKVVVLPVGNKTVDCSYIIQWAKTWDWGVGDIVAKRLSDNQFKDWETVFVLTVDE